MYIAASLTVAWGTWSSALRSRVYCPGKSGFSAKDAVVTGSHDLQEAQGSANSGLPVGHYARIASVAYSLAQCAERHTPFSEACAARGTSFIWPAADQGAEIWDTMAAKWRQKIACCAHDLGLQQLSNTQSMGWSSVMPVAARSKELEDR